MAEGKRQLPVTNERLGLARILNTRFYLDSRPELRNTEVTWLQFAVLLMSVREIWYDQDS